jgi:diaminopimelate decarboxylase
MRRRHGYRAEMINVGGGLGVRYTDQDRPVSFAEYCQLVSAALRSQLAGSDLDPAIGHEPGRCIVAEAGVTLYTVGAIKTVPIGEGQTRTYVCVDGGLADNPRPALYGSRYTVVAVAGDPARDENNGAATCRVSGRHCETDTLFDDVALPRWLQSGDLLQVLCTGAYNASMASNYNRYPRPATVLLREDGSSVVVQRPETWDELFAREIVPEEWVR